MILYLRLNGLEASLQEPLWIIQISPGVLNHCSALVSQFLTLSKETIWPVSLMLSRLVFTKGKHFQGVLVNFIIQLWGTHILASLSKRNETLLSHIILMRHLRKSSRGRFWSQRDSIKLFVKLVVVATKGLDLSINGVLEWVELLVQAFNSLHWK